MKTTCQYCNKEFTTYPCRLKRGYDKFCSKECYNKSDDLRVSLSKAQKARWDGHTLLVTNKKCVVCGKEFQVHNSDLDKHQCLCCSMECSGKYRSKTHRGEKHHNWTGGKISRVCIVCGKDFEVKPERLNRTGGKFCSSNCSSMYNVRHSANKKDTDIELIMKSALKHAGIKFKHQKIIKNIAVVDFFIEPNIVVQCDGDYWHSLPKQRKRDIFVDKQLQIEGYRIFRFLGSEIKKDIQLCINRVTDNA